MGVALVIASLWLAFAATHMAFSSVGLRPRLVAALGERNFQGLYSLIALAIFVPLVWFYFANKHAGPHLFYLGGLPGVRLLVYVIMGTAFSLLVAGTVRPSPASVAPGKAEPAGALRLTRHPVLMGIGLFGLAHLLATSVNLAELVFFAGFPILAVVGSRHQDLRKLASGDEKFRRFHATTVFLPFSAPGALPAALREDALPIAIGIGATFVVRYFHPQLFS